MKSSEQKHSSKSNQQPSKKDQPFFAKSEEDAFAQDMQIERSSFFAGDHPVQPKLKIHASNDQYEKEADSVADKVVNQMHTPQSLQRKEKDAQPSVLSNSISSIQRQRAFESPTALEQNSANQGGELQTKSEGDANDNSSVESQLQESKGKGNNLSPETREKMESGMGADFSGVHVHNDDKSAQLSNQLGAKAFTHGNDIYFNKGEYQPSTRSGDHLIAHELTHTVQQGASKTGGVQRQKGNIFSPVQLQSLEPPQKQADTAQENQSVRMKSGAPAESGGAPETNSKPNITSNASSEANTSVVQRVAGGGGDIHDDATTGKVTRSSNAYTLEPKVINVPGFKEARTTGDIVIPTTPRKNQQVADWEKGINDSKVDPLVTSWLAGKTKVGESYILKFDGGFLIGPKDEIKKKIIRPNWDINGKYHPYHVDHIHEFQIGGADEFKNFWLLDASINMKSGKAVKAEKDKRIKDLIEDAATKSKFWPKGKPSVNEVKAGGRFTVKFQKAEGKLKGFKQELDAKDRYEVKDIEAGESLKGLKQATDNDLKTLGVTGNTKEVTLFLRATGGKAHKFNVDKPDPITVGNLGLQPQGTLNVDPVTKKIQDGSKIKVEIFRRNEQINKTLKFKNGEAKTFDVKVYSLGGLPNVGYINSSEWHSLFGKKLEAAGLSPLEFESIDIDDKEGMVIRGKIKPSIPVIANADISFVITGNDIYIEKTFTASEFKVPAPFKINSCSLTVRAGTIGLELEGDISFEIQRVGEGTLSAFINSKKEFGVKGEFTFDKKLFDNAKVKVSYLDQKWAVEGVIEIPPKKIKGIKKASATIAYSEGVLAASGKVEPDIKGVKEGSFDLKYSEEQFIINGRLQLSNDIPRLKRGEINVTVESKGEGYKLKGSGIAEFDIPGISTGLNVQYDDGALTIEASVTFEKGIAKGEVKAGATNRPIDAEGKPTGEPGSKWTFYGAGKLTVKITPWLQATAGVKFLPNGELEVLGRIELPSAVDVFKRKSIKEPLFTMPTIEIPIFAIPLGPKSLGIVAQINGGLDFEAGIGPGQIKDLFGEIKYNPSRPEETTLSGGGKFVIPADASLKLHGDLSLGLSIGIASVTGGIEIAASVGLQGEASAAVNLEWNPTTGLELNAVGEVKVSPRFKFDVNLLARAKLDLWIKTFKKEWRHNLASYEWGPGFDFGLRFPIHYKEGQPFDVSFKDIEVIKPNIDILSTAKGLARDIKDKVF